MCQWLAHRHQRKRKTKWVKGKNRLKRRKWKPVKWSNYDRQYGLSAQEQSFARSFCSLSEGISFLLLLTTFIAQIYTQESRTFKSVQPKFKRKQKKRYKKETKDKIQTTQKTPKCRPLSHRTLTTIGLYYKNISAANIWKP